MIIRTILGSMVALVLLCLAFYGGEVYQNHNDQSLFAQYVPPQAAGARGAGSAGSGGTVVNAALSLGDPPAGNSTAAPATSPPAAKPGTGTTAPPTAGATTNGSSTTSGGGANGGTATGSGAAAALIGKLTAAGSASLTLQTLQGKPQSVSTTASTKYYQAALVPVSTLAVGQSVSVATTGTLATSISATSVTISPVAGLIGTVRSLKQMQTALTAGVGAAGGTRSGAGAGSSGGGAAGGGGFGGGAGRPMTGTIASISNGSMGLQTQLGFPLTVTVPATTTVYTIQATTSAQIHTGTIVSVRTSTASGSLVATDVVGSTIDGMIASLAAPRTRSAGAGASADGSGGGGNGAGFGANG